MDDGLDVFAVHGVGGILGTLLVSVLALPVLGVVGYAKGVSVGSQFIVQLVGVFVNMLWSGVATYLNVRATKLLMDARPNDDDIEEGLDLSAHGQRGYTLQ